ncbi:InlB B-repeat-containing protein [uncultured Parabacteroides sp.]|uniref:InlB B-repeat-containing protein n=1 Tax=uncultured Parabacteroides sp. TaxID=512312 RepID=UPI00259BEDEE|nr:InlB B-repeat-containing protein [uncultured Parabacteroides sp.]
MEKKLRVYIFFIFCLVLAFPFSGRADENHDITNGDVMITQAGNYRIEDYTGTNKVVVNAEGQEVNITISGLNIDVSGTNGACAFDIQAGTVNLTLEGENVLKSGSNIAGLQVPKGSTLTINGDGKLNAFGGANGAGIGGEYKKAVGTITITGGTVTAIGGGFGAGIGEGYKGSECTIIITGGTVTAIGGGFAAGIGGGYNSSECTITITGGTVTATGSSGGAGIGAGIDGQSGTFSTKGGNAFIIASSISDNSDEKKKEWQGVIFEEDDGYVYGNPTITTDAEILDGKTLTIDEDKTLTISDGITFTNNGVIKCDGNIKGSIAGNKLTYAVTYKANNSTDNKEINYIEDNQAPSYDGFSYKYHTFDGWYTDETGDTKVESITQATTVYAHWKKNEIKAKDSPTLINGTYGKEITAYNLSDLLSNDSYKDNIKYTISGDENYGLSISESQITGTPNKTAAKGSTITITISSTDCESSIEAKIPIHIKWKSNIDEFAVISDRTYNGKAVEITAPTVKDESDNQINDATAELSYQIKTDGDRYEPTSANNSGASDEGEAPKYAGEYKVTASFAGNDNYAIAEEQTATFTIQKAALTVTPLSNQIIFLNEKESFKPKYEVTGAVNNEEPQFNGNLKLDNDGKIIVDDNLTLKETFDKNYSMTITEDVKVTILDNAAANKIIILSGKIENGAYIDEVTITAPEGFLIKLVSGTQTKAEDGYDKSFPWNKIGTFEISYKLKRKDGGQESDTYKITVTVKKEHEESVEPGTPVIPPVQPEEPVEPPTHYTVTLPSVVGATTDPAAGDHEVEEGDSFRFRLTLDKDYDLSKPVVTTDYGAVIASQGEDGVYVINQVSRSFEIRIDGVVKNPDPVANTEIQSGIKVWGNNHRLFIRTDRPEEVAVYTFSGQLQKKFHSEVGDRFISLPSGTYIVLIGDERFKVIL